MPSCSLSLKSVVLYSERLAQVAVLFLTKSRDDWQETGRRRPYAETLSAAQQLLSGRPSIDDWTSINKNGEGAKMIACS